MAEHEIFARSVYFSVFGNAFSLEELTRRIGVSPDRVRREGEPLSNRPYSLRRRTNIWEIREFGGNDADTSALINAVCNRLESIKEKIQSLSTADWSRGLSVVQYVRDDDPISSGFVLEEKELDLLTYIHASINVETYVMGDDDDPNDL